MEPVWLRPQQAMTDLPFIGRLNTVFVVAIAIGMGIILMCMVFNIINSLRSHDVERTYFDTNGVAAWWFYSSCLGIFFVALPFSRYMHIFTEIPLIFLRHYGLRSGEKESSFDHFQIEACSRCGVCIDPCQL